MRLKLGRRPIRRRHRFGPVDVNASDLHVTSTTFRAGPISRDSRGRWKLHLPFGFHILLGGRR